jgi:nitroimidazol reductase NimA-like FMN-containing flavoprotein (pyridoxamine 5'-phosphate oxidase superfamily)
MKEMRRKDRLLAPAEAMQILMEGTYGILSLNGLDENDYAYGVPVGYAVDGSRIYIHCAPVGEKIDRIHGNNRVSFCVVGAVDVLADQFATNYASAIAFGRAAEVADEDEKRKALLAFLDKYSADFVESGKQYIAKFNAQTKVLRIDVEKLTGKARKA